MTLDLEKDRVLVEREQGPLCHGSLWAGADGSLSPA